MCLLSLFVKVISTGAINSITHIVVLQAAEISDIHFMGCLYRRVNFIQFPKLHSIILSFYEWVRTTNILASYKVNWASRTGLYHRPFRYCTIYFIFSWVSNPGSRFAVYFTTSHITLKCNTFQVFS